MTTRDTTLPIAELPQLDSGSYVPLYVQLADRLITAITSGRLPAGTRLPSESECGSHFGVSRLTVRQAMDQLKTRGLILRDRGRGTFVAPVKVDHDLALAFEDETAAAKHKVDLRLIAWREEAPDSVIGTLLNLDRGESVYRLERLRSVDGVPISLEERLIPGATGAKMSSQQVSTLPLFRIIEHASGRRIARARFTISGRSATQTEADLLQVEAGAPLIVRSHTYLDESGLPLFSGQSTFVGERYSFHFEASGSQIRMASTYHDDLSGGGQ
ncbi:MAG: GntR family transcriptional regulator [Hyphomicrobiales bacterium]